MILNLFTVAQHSVIKAFEYKICSDLMVVPVVNVHSTELNLSPKVVMSEFMIS